MKADKLKSRELSIGSQSNRTRLLPFSFTAAFNRAPQEPTALTLHVVSKHADLMKWSSEFSIQISNICRNALGAAGMER
jgi:hypothetical protein